LIEDAKSKSELYQVTNEAKLEKCDKLTPLYHVEGIGLHGELSSVQLSH
jgi:hypothetical protein